MMKIFPYLALSAVIILTSLHFERRIKWLNEDIQESIKK